jgi:formylglycine-generating enzyme required for sulfatase activity
VRAGRDLTCADLIGRDKITHTTYNIAFNFSPAQNEKLIAKALEFFNAGLVFTPLEDQPEAYRAERDGETLTFRPRAVKQLLSGKGRTERSYLLGLMLEQQYSRWARWFVPLKARVIRREDLNLPVTYLAQEPPPPDAGPEAQVTSVPLNDILEALDRYAAFVILGAPGAGKTTTLEKIAFERAKSVLEKSDGRVPLLVRLSQQHARTPFEFLRGYWERRMGTDFADALADGRVLVLADGINELPRDPDTRAAILRDWRALLDEYGGLNQFVFTSRETGEYAGQLDVPNVRVEPLDDERIADYLRRREAEDLWPHLRDPRLRTLAGNPFFLMLMISAFRDEADLLGNRGRLLGHFVSRLLLREADKAHPGWSAAEPVLGPALAQLAFAMRAAGLPQTIAERQARGLLPAEVDVDGEALPVIPRDIFRFARGATLLDPGLPNQTRFFHELLQEYFAARELLRRFDLGEDLSRLWIAPRRADEMPPATVGPWDPLPTPPGTGWEETTLLACGLAEAPARLIEAISPYNPNLAARCCLEAGIPQPPISNLKSRLQHDLLKELYDPAIHLRARLQAGYTLGRLGDPRFEGRARTVEFEGRPVRVIAPDLTPVPAGTYVIGSGPDDPNAFAHEKPQHTVELPAFAIGRWPVTNAEYACFLEAGGYTDERWWKTELARRWLRGEDVMGGQLTILLQLWRFTQTTPDWRDRLEATGAYSPDQLRVLDYLADLSEEELKAIYSEDISAKSRERPALWEDPDYDNLSQPVVGLTWFEANAYCAWLSAMLGREYRLPTEAEWEAASRGLTPLPLGEGDATLQGVRVYPWGNDWDPAKANTIEGRVLKPSPVGAYTAADNLGPFGMEDAVGNVWNWTSTLYLDYPYTYDAAHESPEAEGERVVRGGAWGFHLGSARCAYRFRGVPDGFYFVVGFRVVSPVLS